MCAPSFFSGTWDSVVLSAAEYFASPQLRHNASPTDLVVYGPPHLFRKAWLSGARDYLREPWQPEELFLRVRGPMPPTLEWNWASQYLCLEGMQLWTELKTKRIKLSRTEADLLRILVLRQGQVVSRSSLSWAAQCSGGRVIDTLITRLRKKVQVLTGLEDDPVPSVRGLGYRIP